MISAFDICPCNIVLNEIAIELGKNFDEGGNNARTGLLNNQLLEKLNSLEFYKVQGAKSLGREWVEENFFLLVNSIQISSQDKLNTVCEHIAQQISKHATHGKMLVTGGGAYNNYLIERIKFHSSADLIIPEKKIIEFKKVIIK
mgnify:CR=1 FL=1